MGLRLAPQGQPVVAQPALDALEAAGAEQPGEQPVPLGGVGAQERLELTLGKQGNLAELVEVHPQQPGEQVTGLVEPAAERHPGVVHPFGDADFRLLAGQPGATLLGPVPGGGADHSEAAVGQRDVQLDPRREPSWGLVGSQPPGVVAVAGDGAVQGEAHGVEDAGLPGAGGTGEQEEAGIGQGVEVDLGGLDERAEGGDREPVETHQPARR